VIFYGVGPECGFAACTYARFAPGARVLAAGPVATLDPAARPVRAAFRSARRLPFPGRWALGPRASPRPRALILYDPTEFAPPRRPRFIPGRNVTRVALPYAGRDFSRILQEAEAAVPVLRLLERDEASPAAVRAALKDTCRRNPGTMVRRTRAALVQGHPARARIVAEHGLALSGDKRLSALLAEVEAAGPLARA
jgi:hypothetical protein